MEVPHESAPAPTHYSTPPTVTEVVYEAPRITVEAPRLTDDQRITDDGSTSSPTTRTCRAGSESRPGTRT